METDATVCVHLDKSSLGLFGVVALFYILCLPHQGIFYLLVDCVPLWLCAWILVLIGVFFSVKLNHIIYFYI